MDDRNDHTGNPGAGHLPPTDTKPDLPRLDIFLQSKFPLPEQARGLVIDYLVDQLRSATANNELIMPNAEAVISNDGTRIGIFSRPQDNTLEHRAVERAGLDIGDELDAFGLKFDPDFIGELIDKQFAALPHRYNTDGKVDETGSIELTHLSQSYSPTTMTSTLYVDGPLGTSFTFESLERLEISGGKIHVFYTTKKSANDAFWVLESILGFLHFGFAFPGSFALPAPDGIPDRDLSPLRPATTLLEMLAPQFLIPNTTKKIQLTWRTITARDGIALSGGAAIVDRNPKLTIAVPSETDVHIFDHNAIVALGLRHQDLRTPFKSITWTSDGSIHEAHRAGTHVSYPTAGKPVGTHWTHTVHVTVVDQDGVELKDSATFGVRVVDIDRPTGHGPGSDPRGPRVSGPHPSRD